ncbi:MAG: alpha/beta hydrolase [Parvularculaceae bacterium]|nr:alpha/beta hydrolase [Parvularculaceae bacterium]
MTAVDPKTRVLLDMIAMIGAPPLHETTPQQFRDMRARSRDMLNEAWAEPAHYQTFEIAGAAGPIRARLYDDQSGHPRPTLVYYHGGGFIYGDLDSHDQLCRRLARIGDLRVISVEYRLAPEAPFPAAVEDAWAALSAIIDRAKELGVDPDRIAVGGDSAGANLATVAARRAAIEGGPQIRHQLLFYPVTQCVRSTPSREKFAQGFFLTKESMDWFDGHYLPKNVDRADARVSPLLHPVPANLAPALVITAGFDPLLDEGRDYAEHLSKAGVSCRYVEYPSQIHGFVSFCNFSSVAEEAIANAAQEVRKVLG